MAVPSEPVPQIGGVTSKPETGVRGRYSGNGAAQRNSGDFHGQGDPAGEDGVRRPYEAEDDELENAAERAAVDGAEQDDDFDDEDDFEQEKPTDAEFLQMVSEATSQAAFYSSQINRRAWERAYKAYRQEHFTGSKYTQPDFKNRSRLFIPKTRSAVRKDLAATSASMFGTVDPIECAPGNEADPKQRGGAEVIKQLVSYRTDSANGKAAMPWFHTAIGARMTSLMTGFCVSKQFWNLKLRRKGTEEFDDEGTTRERDVWVPHIDRPESLLIAPENCTIDPACDWTNPAQDSAYFIIKYPMRIDEIRSMQRDPRRPWNAISDSVLRSAGEGAKLEAAAIRRARDQGLDRFEQSANSANFDVIWVYETFMRTAGEDWQFWSIGDQAMLTDPAPVGEVYPEQDGERPLSMGYGSFEAFCVFPMAAVESWQMLQQEANDVRNLTLDAFKQNVMPVTKVVRGRQIDLDQLKRRGQGTSIMVNNKDDVTWERPPDVPVAAQAIKQQLDIDFDDLAGQQNYGTVQDNNALGKTLGGLKLAAGAANAVQEFDLRVWIETWAEKTVRQIVKLEQFYESDPIVLGVAGDKAQLFEKHGISEIDDEMLENNVTVRVSVGLGAGDPQQVLQKFQAAATVALPLLQMDPRFASGELQIDGEAVMAETFGRGAGFRDGGKRFIKKGEAKGPDPAAQAALAAEGEEKKASAGLKQAQAKKAVIDALVSAAKVGIDLHKMGIDTKKMEFDQSIAHMDQLGRAVDMGQSHGLAMQAAKMAAKGLNVDGSPIDMPGTEPGADYPDGKVPPEVLGAMPAGAGATSGEGGAPPSEAGGGAPPPAAAPTPGTMPMPEGMPEPPAKPAAGAEPAAEPAAKKKRTVRITGRDPATNRANAFEIED